MITLRVRRPSKHPREAAHFVRIRLKGVTYDIEGELIEVFRIGTLAKALGRSARTIREWERAGHIPPPLFRIEGSQVRFYSATQICRVQALACDAWRGRQHVSREELEVFFRQVKAVWYQPPDEMA